MYQYFDSRALGENFYRNRTAFSLALTGTEREEDMWISDCTVCTEVLETDM